MDTFPLIRNMMYLAIILVMIATSSASYAALAIKPVVPGYTSGSYRAASATFTFNAANGDYIQLAIVNVGGKPITVPASLRLAANAGNYVKSAMRANPLLLVGTLAAEYLAQQGIEWDNGWYKSVPDYGVNGVPCPLDPATCAMFAHANVWTPGLKNNTPPHPGCYNSVTSYDPPWRGWTCGPLPTRRPAKDADWESLPNPLPSVAPELPYAPYMPQGVPVQVPRYDFAPISVPLGQPYTRPDGSIVQPKASIRPTPDRDGVIVDTHDLPAPQPDTANNPTPTQQPDSQLDPCLKNPDRIGCMKAGALDNTTLKKESVNLTFAPEGSPITGSCPAPIPMPGGHVLDFASACEAMTTIRPIVLALAGVLTAYLIIGVVRQ